MFFFRFLDMAMSFKSQIEQLKAFSEKQGVKAIIAKLEGLENNNIFSFFSRTKNFSTDAVETLRRELLDILKNEKKVLGIIVDKELGDICHNVLLKLARLSPLNTEDPSTLEPIASQSRVFVSTGHQYDIHQLINYHNHRDPRGNEEEKNYKSSLNLSLNMPFSYRDSTHIQEVAAEKQVIVNRLVNPASDALNLIKIAKELKKLFNNASDEEVADFLFELVKFPYLFKSDLSSTVDNIASLHILFWEKLFIFAQAIAIGFLGTSLFMASYTLDSMITAANNSLTSSDPIKGVYLTEIGLVIGLSLIGVGFIRMLDGFKESPATRQDFRANIAAI